MSYIFSFSLSTPFLSLPKRPPSHCMSCSYKLNSLHGAFQCDSLKEFRQVPSSPKTKGSLGDTLFEMEILNPAKGKTYKLPVGYRFDPADDVLAGYYLRKKMLTQPLPNDLIQDCDVFQTEPWGLPGGGKHMNWQRFFFYDTRTRVFENTDKRGAGNGQWRVVERGQDVELNSKQVIAKRNILVFWEANGNSFAKTNWAMHEFRLAPKSNQSLMSAMAVYRIFEMKQGRKGKKAKVSKAVASNSRDAAELVDDTPTVIDFTLESGSVSGPPSPMTP